MQKKPRCLKEGFTAVEIVAALTVPLLLGTFAILSYLKFLESVRESVCETNLKGLQGAVQIYGPENFIPAISKIFEILSLRGKEYDPSVCFL